MIDWPVSQPTLSIDVASPRGKVVLRPLREDDIEAIFQACQDPTISAFTRVPFPYDREMAEEFVRGSELGYRNHQSLVFAIEVGGVFAGAMDLHSINLSDHGAEIGYWMEKSFRGEGICSAAAELLLDLALNVMKFRRIEGLADFNNFASQRVLEKAGMTREALLRKKVTKPNGDQIDMVLFAITKEE
jgi:RimJ/RimL family protein N-acetyltransferase